MGRAWRLLGGDMRPARARGGFLAAAVAVSVGTFTLTSGAGVAAASSEPTSGQPAPLPAAPPSPETAPAPKPAHVVLSNERTSTTWAHPVEAIPIRARPEVRSRTLGRTRLATEDGFPEVYVLLSRFTDAKGSEWMQIRIPGRPNGRTGWVPRESFGEFHVTHWLVEIALRSRRLKAYYNGKLRFNAPVGVGKPSTPTPTGHFYIREIFKLASPSNPYWPYAIGTSDYSTLTDWPGGGVVGIHGDFGEPQLIPGDPSHGCVRMHSRDIAWLAPRVSLGTPVHIVA
jgi:L,D-transpeptidase catalytic domain